jgi:hypothetical protein
MCELSLPGNKALGRRFSTPHAKAFEYDDEDEYD